MKRPLPLAACIALITVPFTALSQDAQPAAPAVAPSEQAAPAPTVGDADKGRLLAYTCQGCHGIEGYKNAYPSYKVPKIGGQSPEYLALALHEYQQGKRRHPTMQAQAQSFSDQDIADLAAFLSTIK